MALTVRDGLRTLTEKEKQTLRLIVRGHDAKSIARVQNLSVHTINERLRDARRKLSVSSSREAARMLHDAEDGNGSSPTPDSLGDKHMGEDTARPAMDQERAPHGARRAFRPPAMIIGVFIMTITLGLLALAALTQGTASPPLPAPPITATPVVATRDAAVVSTARQWLALLDERNWAETYRGTSTAFRQLNTLAAWTDASHAVRDPLGAMQSRTLVSVEILPAPPAGYEVVKFRTSFANRRDAVETVTLEREDGGWRVAGIIIE